VPFHFALHGRLTEPKYPTKKMNLIEIMTLFGIMVALAVIPSASVALVITRSATLGVTNGIAVSAGIVLGDLIFILLAIFGLSVVAETMGGMFIVIKYLGAVYLLWLGFSLFTSKSNIAITLDKKIDKRNLAASFLAGLFLTLGDIKAIIFYISLFPVFIDVSTLQITDILIIISIMVLGVGGVKVLYAFSAIKVASFAKKYKLENISKKVAAGLMVAAGSWLILKT
jgi:threonine/homoserine/homoserine lactone efflux protein